MSDHEHTINRADSTQTTTDDVDGDTDAENQRSEAEIKRELRKSEVGRAILQQARARKGRR